MKNLKSNIRDFLNSEDGRVGVKKPLTAGVAAGGLMLLQAMISTPEAQAYQLCSSNGDCASGDCDARPFSVLKVSPSGHTYWAVEWHEVCV
jgi:hypothetical protein